MVHILAEAKRRNIPLFLVDLSPPGWDELGEDTIPVFVKGLTVFLEIFIGVKILARAIKQPVQSESGGTMDRRSLLKKSGLAILGTYLLTPGLETILYPSTSRLGEPVEKSISRNLEKKLLRGFNETFHPELSDPGSVRLRNTLIAQKSEAVAHVLKAKIGRPIVNIYIGAAHDLEDELKRDENSRMKDIREALPESYRSEGIIARIDFVTDENGDEAIQITLLQDPAFQK